MDLFPKGLKSPIEGMTGHDAVQRRFKASKDIFTCKQCNSEIQLSPGKQELKLHFENVSHQNSSQCLYCNKPVYEYEYKNKTEVYHVCQYE